MALPVGPAEVGAEALEDHTSAVGRGVVRITVVGTVSTQWDRMVTENRRMVVECRVILKGPDQEGIKGIGYRGMVGKHLRGLVLQIRDRDRVLNQTGITMARINT